MIDDCRGPGVVRVGLAHVQIPMPCSPFGFRCHDVLHLPCFTISGIPSQGFVAQGTSQGDTLLSVLGPSFLGTARNTQSPEDHTWRCSRDGPIPEANFHAPYVLRRSK
jgi:hypothetical protein